MVLFVGTPPQKMNFQSFWASGHGHISKIIFRHNIQYSPESHKFFSVKRSKTEASQIFQKKDGLVRWKTPYFFWTKRVGKWKKGNENSKTYTRFWVFSQLFVELSTKMVDLRGLPSIFEFLLTYLIANLAGFASLDLVSTDPFSQWFIFTAWVSGGSWTARFLSDHFTVWYLITCIY